MEVFGHDQHVESGLLGVADQQDVTDHRGVVPRLALDRGEAAQLGELVGRRPDERQLAARKLAFAAGAVASAGPAEAAGMGFATAYRL